MGVAYGSKEVAVPAVRGILPLHPDVTIRNCVTTTAVPCSRGSGGGRSVMEEVGRCDDWLTV